LFEDGSLFVDFPLPVPPGDAREGGAILGYAYLAPFRTRAAYSRTAEDTIYLKQGFQGRGMGRALLAALLEETRRRASLHAIIACVTVPNAASRALHEGAGFTPVGVFPQVGRKQGRWFDVGWWELVL
jgi:phosphinothricin acetyltransferase